MEDNKLLRLVYTFFLGVLLAIFVGVGINTFYPGPKPPEFPVILNSLGKEPTAAELKIQRAYDVKMTAHNQAMKPYNRNVSIISLVFAVGFLAISIIFEKRIRILADGVMLGGLFLLLYSIGRGFASEDSKYVFVIVGVGLVVVLYLGFRRFVQLHATLKTAPDTS